MVIFDSPARAGRIARGRARASMSARRWSSRAPTAPASSALEDASRCCRRVSRHQAAAQRGALQPERAPLRHLLRIRRVSHETAIIILLARQPRAYRRALDRPRCRRAADAREAAPRRRARSIAPYIEASQVFAAELSPGNDTVTYTHARRRGRCQRRRAATTAARSRSATSARSARTATRRRSTLVSGLARGYATVMPHGT